MGICTCVNGMNGNGMNGQTSRVMSLVARRTGPGVGCPPIRSHHGGDGQRGVATVPQLHMMMGMKRRRNERRMYAGRMVMVKASVALESFMGDDGELEVPDMERYGPCRGNKSRPCGDGRADEKGPGKKPVTPKSATLVDVIPYLLHLALADRGLYWRLGGAMVALVVSKAAGLLAPLYFKAAVDAILLPIGHGVMVVGHIVPSVTAALLLSGVCRALNSVSKEIQSPMFTPVSQAAGRNVSYQSLSHVLNLDLHFHLGRNTGALARMLERGSRSISMIFRAVMFTLIPTALELVAVCWLLARSFQWQVSAAVAVAFVVYFLWTVFMTWTSTKIRREVKDLDNEIGGRAVDALLNVEAVKLAAAEQYEVESYDERLLKYQKATVRLEVAAALLNAGQGVVLAVGMTAALILAATSPGVTPGDVVMIQGLLLQLWAPLQFLGWFYRELRQSLVDMEDLFQLMRTDSRIVDGTIALQDAESMNGATCQGVVLDMTDVSFKYPGTRRRVLRGVTIRAEPGQSIAVVGPSGSGKSTLLRLLVRLFDVDSGSVKIDGIDVRDLTQSSIRNAVAVVPQDTVLFNDTILHNVSYGRPNATGEEVYTAVNAAKLMSAIKQMPDGWKTEVGERGLKLSGGEKQRVAIARAFLKMPRLLICDEATSALDTSTEQGIIGSLEELASGRTSVFVAHRLSTIQGCDKIYVLKDGTVAEEGSHAELMDRDGLYKEMWMMQAAEDAIEERTQEEESTSSSEEEEGHHAAPKRVLETEKASNVAMKTTSSTDVSPLE